MQSADVVIVGAGVIGLALALRLRATGRSVTVLESGAAMRESSWAAAGMLAANDPENPAALYALSQLSARLYPDFLEQLQQLSGQKVPLRSRLTLQATHEATPAEGCGIPWDVLTAEQARKAAPALSEHALSSWQWLLLEEDSLDPRDLCRALPLAARAMGVEVLERTAVTALTAGADEIFVETGGGTWKAQHVVNCAGAWASGLARLLPQMEPECFAATGVRPRKGQILSAFLPSPHLPGEASLPDMTVRTPGIYIVPRGAVEGGSLCVIGATVEETGFDKSQDPETTDHLLETATQLLPELNRASVREVWTGLRPGSADDLPAIGAMLRVEGEPTRCWMAGGLFRNGILMAPGIAHVMTALLEGEPSQIALEAFDPLRHMPLTVDLTI